MGHNVFNFQCNIVGCMHMSIIKSTPRSLKLISTPNNVGISFNIFQVGNMCLKLDEIILWQSKASFLVTAETKKSKLIAVKRPWGICHKIIKHFSMFEGYSTEKFLTKKCVTQHNVTYLFIYSTVSENTIIKI